SSDCRVQIPFEIPAGFRMQVVKISYRGFASVPSGGQAIFETSFRFTEPDHRQKKQNFVIRRKKFVGPREDLFTISSKIRGPHWSPCGQRFTLLAESRIFVQSNSAGEEALATVDSLDSTTSPAVYHLRWKKCR
ncbi:MAG: DUF4360 domain-containing protein, partial [Bdellovibrionaceae bacterium]|nr:DUF4360 domain-containing protein [Pseudobdellovibrionaceae bacterium]